MNFRDEVRRLQGGSGGMNPFKKGDRVRLKHDPKSVEKVGRVDDDRVYVCFGFFTLAYPYDAVELVQPADITNDAPRRRTEPAITVPPAWEVGARVNYYGDPKWLGTVVGMDDEGDPQVKWDRDPTVIIGYYADMLTEHIEGRTFTVSAIEAFSPAEVEQCKQHGAAAYESMAADIAQVRELARAAWVRSLPTLLPYEALSDYAARANILPPKPGKREQWEDSVRLAAAERMAMEMSNE